jgi:hypothetical protein
MVRLPLWRQQAHGLKKEKESKRSCGYVVLTPERYMDTFVSQLLRHQMHVHPFSKD